MTTVDPVRQIAHVYLSVADAVLSRSLDVVRLVDGLLVSTAQVNVATDESREAWPEEETGDLSTVSAALRSKAVPEGTRPAATKATKATAGRPAPQRTAPRKAAQKKTPTKRTPAKKSPATKSTSRPSSS